MHLTHDNKQENNQDNNVLLQWAKITTRKGHQYFLIQINKQYIYICIYIIYIYIFKKEFNTYVQIKNKSQVPFSAPNTQPEKIFVSFFPEMLSSVCTPKSGDVKKTTSTLWESESQRSKWDDQAKNERKPQFESEQGNDEIIMVQYSLQHAPCPMNMC